MQGWITQWLHFSRSIRSLLSKCMLRNFWENVLFALKQLWNPTEHKIHHLYSSHKLQASLPFSVCGVNNTGYGRGKFDIRRHLKSLLVGGSFQKDGIRLCLKFFTCSWGTTAIICKISWSNVAIIPRRAPWHESFWERLVGLTKQAQEEDFGENLCHLTHYYNMFTLTMKKQLTDHTRLL